MGCFKGGCQLPSSVRHREFRGRVRDFLVIKKGFCYVELITWLKLVTLMYTTLNFDIVLRLKS
jgi:hypothetical protein